MATTVFVLRELIALIFVLAWLVGCAVDLFLYPDTRVIPFWGHCVGIGVLAYSLGVNVENITAFSHVAPQPQHPVVTKVIQTVQDNER